ncbi:MAG: ABC transporter substrate-binding protein [Candidatus Limivicinus sp.]|nr:ABC transporter substrate-binding protein [Candidatus Limivicinus sp.]
MSNIKKILALVLALVMVFALCACGESNTPAPEESKAPVEESKAPVEENTSTLVYATSTFGQKFSPFFYTTAYDEEVVSNFTGGLLAADRGGAIIHHGIEGETVEYNGTDYTYYGMGDVDVVQNDDGSVDYNLTMRDDIVFSDGTPATIDDVIFGIYVMADPSYDGSSTVYALPIEGMADYYNSQQYLYKLLAEAGRDNTDFTLWDEATQTAFWASVDAAGEKFAQEIIDYVVASYNTDEYAATIEATPDEIAADPALQVKFGMNMWGYGDAWTEGATAADYWAAIEAAYGDIIEASDTETAGSSLFDLMDDFADYDKLVATGDDVPNIKGIIRTGDYSLTVHMTEYDATAIYNMSFIIAPLHHYGDVSKYDYDNNKFGFDKGDLSGVKAKTTEPLGCGPYIFKSYENGVVTMEANPTYFLGEPKTKTILFKEGEDADYVPGIVTGTYDLAVPSISEETLNAITDANSNGELTGDTLTTFLVDYRGYGYLGINADLVNIDGDPGSEESKALRKGFMTVLAVYRDTVINSYYGDRAAVIQYPISNTSWAAPQPADEGYRAAYSVDADGNDIFDSSMNDEQKYDAALKAAVTFFEKAGYTFDADGKVVSAPAGAPESYEILIPGNGKQDHPTYGIATAASKALETIGIKLTVNDVGSSVWNNALEGNTAQMWVAAWQSTADPDMYQVYHSSNAHGKGTNSNHYQVDDPALDALIIDGRTSADTEYRKSVYKQAMEIIMDWGVELPVYQRKDCTVASTIRVDCDTLPKDMTPYWGWKAEIETLAVK